MDVQLLSFTAGLFDEFAATIRQRAGLLGTATATVRWRSPAARVFLARADAAGAQLVALAHRVDAVAEQVRVHATLVAASRK